MAMDEQNLRALKQLAPEEHAHKLKMLTDFCSNGERGVPDPYAGGPQGFEFVLDLVEDASQGLLRQIRTQTQVYTCPTLLAASRSPSEADAASPSLDDGRDRVSTWTRGASETGIGSGRTRLTRRGSAST